MRILGVIIFTVGIIFLFDPTVLRKKISTSLLLLGFLMIYLSYSKNKSAPRTLTGPHLLFVIAIWILLVFAFTIMAEVEIFIIVVIIGILALKVLTEQFIDPQIKKRMNILFYIFFIIFALFMVLRIINIVHI